MRIGIKTFLKAPITILNMPWPCWAAGQQQAKRRWCTVCSNKRLGVN